MTFLLKSCSEASAKSFSLATTHLPEVSSVAWNKRLLQLLQLQLSRHVSTVSTRAAPNLLRQRDSGSAVPLDRTGDYPLEPY